MFVLYKDGSWEIIENEIYSYMIPFDPDYKHFADFLNWSVSWDITNYLMLNGLSIDVPLTVKLPCYGASSSVGYGAYSMEMTVSSGGAVISWEDDHVEEDESYPVGNHRMPIAACPESGVLTTQ